MHQDCKTDSILEQTSKFVTTLFKEKLPSWAVYHNLQHTLDTVNASSEIGRGSGLTEEDLEILFIAAWFHDTGYLFTIEEHEEKSAEITMNFLDGSKYPAGNRNRIMGCIMATKISAQPQNLLESVICDSDLISLGKPDYFRKNDLLKLELEMRENKKINELAWLKRSLHFLSSHNYFTEYARMNFNSQLELNLFSLQKKIEEYVE